MEQRSLLMGSLILNDPCFLCIFLRQNRVELCQIVLYCGAEWSGASWWVSFLSFFSFFNQFVYFNWRLITLHYCGGFCHTLTWASHGCTCVPHPEPPSHFPPHPIPLGCPSTPALSALFHASNLDWSSISHIVIYMFQCYSLKSSHPRLLPQSPKVCSLHLCLFCCLAYRVIATIFLNSIYMH